MWFSAQIELELGELQLSSGLILLFALDKVPLIAHLVSRISVITCEQFTGKDCKGFIK